MDLTPETLRSATFRDKLRGYHPDDVDEFLESVARGLEVLLSRLRDATERARSAAPAEPTPQTDDAIRTLALAQRTADLAIKEAKAEADRLVRAADQNARRLVGDAEQDAIALAEAAQEELRADLDRLQTARDQLFGEIGALTSWLEGERGRIRRALIEVADRIDNVRDAGDAPLAKPMSMPPPPREKIEALRPAPRPATPPPVVQPTRPPVAPPPVDRSRAAAVPPAAAPAPRHPTPPSGQPAVKPAAEPAPATPAAPAAAAPTPAAPEQPAEPTDAAATTETVETATPAPAPQTMQERSDAAVLEQAQSAMAQETVAMAQETPPDDDPFFAELRRAMFDQSPLGPREDDVESADPPFNEPRTGTS